MPHRTTLHASSAQAVGPWLVSMVMWFNCLRFVGKTGVAVDDLGRLARTSTNLNGMIRWGYVTVQDGIVRPTRAGQRAQAVWRPLFEIVTERWEQRFGRDAIRLRESLSALVRRLDSGLPDCLPILGYGLATRDVMRVRRGVSPAPLGPIAENCLPVLLSKTLHAFAIAFESEADVSLAISANVMRVIESEGSAVRDLPRRCGVSREAVAMAVNFLQKRGYALVSQTGTKRARTVVLTEAGLRAQAAYDVFARAVEQSWRAQFRAIAVESLRGALERIAGDAQPDSKLFLGLRPYPDGWRASVARPAVLPDFPMILHRGGFPDGA